MGKYFVKTILLGDSNVGKTSLMQRYVTNRFSQHYRATIGADFMIKDILIGDHLVTLQIWDTAGQERFRSLGSAFYRGADACIMVYDVSNPESFYNLENWYNEFLINVGISDGYIFLTIGNKVDLTSAPPTQMRPSGGLTRKISEKKIRQWCKTRNCLYLETSAKESINVEKTFQIIAETAIQKLDASHFVDINLYETDPVYQEPKKSSTCNC